MSEAGAKKARTKIQLIEAAYAEILEKGFAGASLEAIARRAGMTKGAIYSNYRDKAQLFLAVRDAKQPRIRLRFELGADFARQVDALAQSVIEDLPSTAAALQFVTDYHRYASADPEFREALSAQYDRMFDRGAAFFSAFADELAVTPREFAVMMQSLILGLMHQSILTPHDVTPETIRQAFRALGQGALKR